MTQPPTPNWSAQAEGLSDLAPDSRRRLDALAPVNLPKGTALFHPGDAVQGFVIVLEGRVDVFLTGSTGRGILLYAVEPGQSCVQSTLGLLGGEDYSGEALTRSDSRLVLIPRATFLTLMDEDAQFRSFVFHAFAQRMQSMMHLLEKVAFARVESRLTQCLLDRAEGGIVRATHAELAVMIGSAREVVSRRLDALVRRGIVVQERGQVVLRDPKALSDLAQSDG